MRKNKIAYAVVCSTGRVRRNNEDNFYCDGHIRADVNDTADVMFSGTVDADAGELFAVFDGMGGESCGEIASLTAAQRAAQYVRDQAGTAEYLRQLADLLNESVVEETKERSLVLMGTTAAMLSVSGDEVFILNAGDSRIYRLSRHELRQLSEDHVAYRRGSAITTFLGMPEGYPFTPYAAKGHYKAGDLYLLCSDGVTDMLSDDEILRIIDDKLDIDVLARALADAALEKGGVDNTTVLLLKLGK